MKLKDLFNPTRNRKTKQEGGTWRKKELKRLGLTSKQLLEMTIPEPKYKFKLKNVK